jgi:hypothetical protein
LKRENKEELSLLRNEYPNIFMDSLLEFIETCPDSKITFSAASYFKLISSTVGKTNIIQLEKPFVIKLVDVYFN